MNARLHRHQVGGRELHVYLPPSYSSSSRRYPVVYIHDFGDIVQSCFNTLEHRQVTGRLPELIFVGIGTANRNDDYTPWPADSLIKSASPFRGKGSSYLRELVETIKPEIDGFYRTLHQPEHTALLGCSLGGLISVYAAYEYPGVFGQVAAISASFWYEGMLEYIRSRPLPSPQPKLFSYVGLLEGVYKTNLQKTMVPHTMAVHKHWQDKGWGKGLLKLEVNPDGTHDSLFFLHNFLAALDWFFAGEEAVYSDRQT